MEFAALSVLIGFIFGYPVAMFGVNLCFTKFNLWGRAFITIGMILPIAGTIIFMHWMIYGG